MTFDLQAFFKLYLPVYLIIYLVIAFVFPSYRTYRQTGINPVTFGKKNTAHDYIGYVMKILIILLFSAVFLFSFANPFYARYLVPIKYMNNFLFDITGLVLIHLSLIWITIAQFQMSNSWRIGIDEVNKTALVTKGFFSISRNPVFLGMMVSVLGLFFIIPDILTFFCLWCTYFIIQIQIRLEEEFLQKQHGEKFLLYKKTTRRLL